MKTLDFDVKKFVKFYNRTRHISKYLKDSYATDTEYGLSDNNKPMVKFIKMEQDVPSIIREFTSKDIKKYCEEFHEDIDNINAKLFCNREIFRYC